MSTAERERRTTAGKRMSALTGKALEDDETFWGHDTWADEDDSGNESFHSSDEDSEAKQDVFDSDFDESESDREEEEQAIGDEEEREIAREERKERASTKRSYMEISRAGREKMKGKKGRSSKRVMGDGINAGIVLNVPVGASLMPGALPSKPVAAAVAVQPAPRRPKQDSKPTLAATRPRRVNQLSKYSSRFRAARSDAVAAGTTSSTPSSPSAAAATSQKRKRQRFTQEELLLEAANDTEPENVRWLLGRKRIQDQSQKDQEVREGRNSRSFAGGKVIERYASRRGYLNSITFPEMDHVPEVLIQSRSSKASVTPAPTFCVITGRRARYRDPRTGKGYYDAEAFRELRRRHAAGEPLDQRKPKAKEITKTTATGGVPVPAPAQPAKKVPPPSSAAQENGIPKRSPLPPMPSNAPTIHKTATSMQKAFAHAKTKENGPKLETTTQPATVSSAATPTPVATVKPTNGSENPPGPKAEVATLSKNGSTPAPPREESALRPPPAKDSSMSPGSSQTVSDKSRRSPRRRKPSAKVLDSMEQQVITSKPQTLPPSQVTPSKLQPEVLSSSSPPRASCSQDTTAPAK